MENGLLQQKFYTSSTIVSVGEHHAASKSGE
jgi:hypothetical protein